MEKSEGMKPPQEIAPRPAYNLRDRLRWFGHKLAATAFVTEVLPGVAAKLHGYARLTRLDRPIGIWLLLALLAVAGSPGAIRPLAAPAEEMGLEEDACASEVTPTSVRIRRLLAPLAGVRLVRLPRAFALATARCRWQLSIDAPGHTLANGLNAPLLI